MIVILVVEPENIRMINEMSTEKTLSHRLDIHSYEYVDEFNDFRLEARSLPLSNRLKSSRPSNAC